MQERLIRVNIQFLLLLSLHIRTASRSQYIGQTGALNLRLHHFGRESDPRKKPWERRIGIGIALLLSKKMLLDCDNGLVGRALGGSGLFHRTLFSSLHRI